MPLALLLNYLPQLLSAGKACWDFVTKLREAAQQSAEWKNAPRSLRWQPPDGTYVEQVVEVKAQMIGKEAAVQVIGKIMDGDYLGKQNSLGLFGPRNFGMLADLVEVLGGNPESLPNAGKTKDHETTEQPAAASEAEKAPSGKGNDYWW